MVGWGWGLEWDIQPTILARDESSMISFPVFTSVCRKHLPLFASKGISVSIPCSAFCLVCLQGTQAMLFYGVIYSWGSWTNPTPTEYIRHRPDSCHILLLSLVILGLIVFCISANIQPVGRRWSLLLKSTSAL